MKATHYLVVWNFAVSLRHPVTHARKEAWSYVRHQALMSDRVSGSITEPLHLCSLSCGDVDAPATVGQVIEMYEQGTLANIYNINSGRVGEIRSNLIKAKLINPDSKYGSRRASERDVAPYGHHVTCPEYQNETFEQGLAG